MQIRSQLSQTRCFSGFFIPGKKKNKRSLHYQRLNEKNIVKCLSLVKKNKIVALPINSFEIMKFNCPFFCNTMLFKFQINDSTSLYCQLVSYHQFILSPIFPLV